MRKGLLVVVCSLALLGAASPATAQRDPFQPPVGSAATEGDAGTQIDPGATPVEAPPASDRLADTGLDVQPWLVLAFALVAFGAAGLALAQVWRITSPRRS